MGSTVVFQEIKAQSAGNELVFIHPSGNQAVILGNVEADNAEEVVAICEYWLQDHTGKSRIPPAKILDVFHETFKNHNARSSLIVVTKADDRFQVDSVGNPGIFQIGETKKKALTCTQPSQDMSQSLGGEQLHVQTNYLELNAEQIFIVCLGDWKQSSIVQSELKPHHLREGNLRAVISSMTKHSNWFGVVFPVEEGIELVRSEWRYNPFIGVQEERRHERLGLQKIADSLFLDPSFNGFKILPCPPITHANSSRLFDGILVSPIGVFLLELKDYFGEVELYLGRDKRNSMILRDRAKEKRETNPVFKLKEGIREFSSIDALKVILTEAKKAALLVFTNNNVKVTVHELNGEIHSTPYQDGDVMICQPENIVQIIKSYAKNYCGKKLKPIISSDQINEISNALLNSGTAEQMVQPDGGFEVQFNKEITTESSGYYKVYPAYLDGDFLWAKAYSMSTLSGVGHQDEVKRISREASVLHKLSRRNISGIPYFYETRETSQALYVFIEPGANLTLEKWVQTQPSRVDRLSLMLKLAEILKHLSELFPQVVHRGINPKNIRITSENPVTPQLINFELCQIEVLGTILADGRRTFDACYQAPEVFESGKILSPKADVFSFMLCLYFALTGNPLIKKDNKSFLTSSIKQRDYFDRLVNTLELPKDAADLWRNGLHRTPAQRPDINRIIESLNEWIG